MLLFTTVRYISEPQTITKKDGTTCIKQTLVLGEPPTTSGDEFVATYLADKPFTLNVDDAMQACLRFRSREYQGRQYQDILLTDYWRFGAIPHLPKIIQNPDCL